jgi:YHS domain-containing protein
MKNDIIKQNIEVPDNLFALLSRYRVVIPGIQRHYVQGANNPKAESVRKQFIKEIFTAIEKKQNEFNLHFIYGPINTNGEDSFVPVDGQQRLTTLWLIARYAAEKAEPSDRKDLLSLLSRFTYEDRINAKRFCQALTCENSRWDITQDPNPDILCQDWFVDYWKEDETVASMIRMLSTIHEEWNKHQDTITAEDVLEAIASKIRFELKIDAFGDDIYMKMNARGLQLTQWENFKGKFSEDLCEDKKEWWVKEMEELSNRFFTCSDEQHELPDNAFFALYARIMAYEARESGVDCGNSIKQLAAYTHNHNTWSQIELPFVPYSDFSGIMQGIQDIRNEPIASSVADTCVKMIKTVLDNAQNTVPYFGDSKLFDTFFHPQNGNELDFTLCCYEYFKKFNNIDTRDFLKDLRLMWNILENVDKQYENPDYRVEFIKKIIDIEDKDLKDKTLYSPKIKEIIGSDAPKQAKEQAEEEAEKAVQMHRNDQSMPNDWNEEILGSWINWNDAIEKAEEYAFFHGSIRFLYEKNSNGKTTWENFATKLSNCMDLFVSEGLSEDKKVKANQVLISHCEDWKKLIRKPVFDAKNESWKQVLTDSSLSECVNGLLLSPNEIVDNHNEIIQILIDDKIWKNLIKETPGYELEWKAYSLSLWLNWNRYFTLKLMRNNCEDILDAFISESKVTFDAPEEERYRTIKGKNYYFAVPMCFEYKYKGKEYHFAWQTWGYIDMYDNDWKRLCEQYDGEMANNFTIHIDKETGHDSSYYIKKIEDCIDCYEKIHNK